MAFESRIQLMESGIPLMNGIWNLSSTDKKSGIQYLESEIQYLESGIHFLESRFRDCLGIPYMAQAS